jgi:hypothetical protein
MVLPIMMAFSRSADMPMDKVSIGIPVPISEKNKSFIRL